MRPPFAAGSIALGLHPVHGLDALGQTEVLLQQARMAEEAGFDGVTLSEHHAGFPGYMPHPLLAANWVLAKTKRIWSGPCPTLLTLRNPVLLAEQLAWTAACFPGRFGAAFAEGYAADDFRAVGRPFEDLARQFDARLGGLNYALSPTGPLADDAAVREWGQLRPPLLCAANSKSAARRAAKHAMGMLLIGVRDPSARSRAFVDAYREAGGAGPLVWVRRVWIGQPPVESQATDQQGSHWGNGDLAVAAGSAAQIAETLLAELNALGDDASLNLRAYAPGVGVERLDEQIARIGAEMLPLLHRGR